MSMPLLYKDVKRLREVIYDSFTVMDIAEPLRSFEPEYAGNRRICMP